MYSVLRTEETYTSQSLPTEVGVRVCPDLTDDRRYTPLPKLGLDLDRDSSASVTSLQATYSILHKKKAGLSSEA